MMTASSGALERVDFHGDTVFAQLQDDGPPLVAVKPIVERLGVDWPNQLQRIKRDDLLSVSMVMITMETPAGSRETVALPLNLIPGFLFGIDDSRVSPEARPLVLAYKRECHAVLYRHFFGGPAAADPTADWDWQVIGAKLQLVRETRLAMGKRHAAVLWEALGLPMAEPPEAKPRTPATQGLDFVRHFIEDAAVEEAAGQVQARHLSEAYDRWARTHDAPAMTERALAMCLDALGFRKHRGRLHVYLGLRLKHISEQLG